MSDNNTWLANAKSLLANSEKRRHRIGSVAERVAALLPEIEAARANGKTWRQIAIDLSDGELLNADAVRIAFDRCGKPKRVITPAPRNGTAKSARPTKPNRAALSSAADEPVIADMFAPMFDARDTRGRNTERDSEREVRS